MQNKMNTPARAAVWAAALTAVIGLAGAARAEVPTTAPSTQPMATRDKAAIEADLQTDMAAMRSAMTGEQVLTDPAARQAATPKLLPALRKVYADFDDMARADPDAKPQAESVEKQLNVMLATLGDADGTARLQAAAQSKDPAVAVDGQAEQLLVRWWSTAKDPAAQTKVADQVELLAKTHPDSVPVTQQLLTMSQLGGASPALTTRMQSLVTGVMKNQLADQAKAQIEGEQKLAALADKPMTITGKTVDGKDFTTADWKGKVILVDFWATWCPPCRAELPRVEKTYADFHPKGLEILGVSNDRAADDLTKFVADAGGKMPWPQLFDASAAPQWNPVTQGFGINGIPTMFLIDKKGICRTVEARENMEDMIPKLLAEK